ncbi:recombination-associated protein RdgC [Herbaspirillum sp. CAH-3]|uniref:recombination-associated protein RdgC n=1 Tax=Herbaspirillum sp. CAH-3 TaxID=2605746 RepID=UPI0012AC9C07|nr:recombination-associated protein RdgC [Herbaspirillum sp. CAH-3]MRT27603.1 recombination-associated protein RdgC [Herbaspirillum sp. CAH-3]
MFKNAIIYRLPARWHINAGQLSQHLAPQTFKRAGNMDMQSQGWIQPRESSNGLVHQVNRQFLLRLQTEKKILPSSVINQVTRERAKELEEQQGFPPGRKQTKELKEQVTDELLPRAFTRLSSMWVWIDPVNGWLVADSSTSARAEEALKLLFKAVPKFPLETVRTVMSPGAAMTDWLASDEAPEGFTVDQDTELRSTAESRATVRYVRHTLEADQLRQHIETGKQCTRLALTWADKISFTMAENLSIKKIALLDVLKENHELTGKNDDERFDGDFMLFTGELQKLLKDLIKALGGIVAEPMKEKL